VSDAHVHSLAQPPHSTPAASGRCRTAKAIRVPTRIETSFNLRQKLVSTWLTAPRRLRLEGARVKRFVSEWSEKVLNGWKVGEYVNSGKSALVFRTSHGSTHGAIKIFDPELVERFGKEEQAERIRRELTLVGAHHENLVAILGGGHSVEHDLFFVVMEYIDAPNLALVINDVPIAQIRPLISQVASAARFLEVRDLVHRDIKPDNIAVFSDLTRAKLLDLGVIRPFSTESLPPLTDREEQVFVGTLQYGSPEFLLRREKQDAEGYRSLTFYQLGAVLYDMVERRRIFSESASPFPRLVQAILYDTPKIESAGKPPDLVNLARNCLVKDPNLRLSIVSWDDFAPALNVSDAVTAAKEGIRKRRARATYEIASTESYSVHEDRRRRKQTLSEILSRIAEQLRAASDESDLPARIVKEIPDDDGKQSMLFAHFRASAKFGLPVDFYFGLRLTILEITAQAVTLDCAAATSKQPLREDFFEAHFQSIFSGVYDDAVVRLAIEGALFPAFESAMDDKDVDGPVVIRMSKAIENA
jgi:serine/threonine protein kinase